MAMFQSPKAGGFPTQRPWSRDSKHAERTGHLGEKRPAVSPLMGKARRAGLFPILAGLLGWRGGRAGVREKTTITQLSL